MPGITDPTEAYFKDGTWGWDGTQWRKLALVWGYSDVYGESVTEVSTGGASTIVYSSVVPTGEVWVISSVIARHDDPVARNTLVFAVVGGTTVFLLSNTALAQWIALDSKAVIILKKDDYLYCEVSALANTKNVYLAVCGYKMSITE